MPQNQINNVTKESIIRVTNDFIIWCRHKYKVEGHDFQNPILRELSMQLEVWEHGGAEDEVPKWPVKVQAIATAVGAMALLGLLTVFVLGTVK